MDTKKVLIIAGLAAVVLVASYFIFFPKIKPEKSKEEEEKEEEEEVEEKEKDYTPESFPLKKGMYGERIRRVRAVLNLSPTDIFDAELETLLIKKYGVKTISETTYNFYNNKWVEL